MNSILILYERVLRHKGILHNKSDTLWNINLNIQARSMRGILMLFEDAASGSLTYTRDTKQNYNPKVTKLDLIVEGVPNQIYAQGLRSYHTWEEAKTLFLCSPSSKRDQEVTDSEMQLCLSDVTLPSFLTSKFCVWLDLQTTDDKALHGNGHKIENRADGLTIQITKTAETAGQLNYYLYCVMDAQLNIENGSLNDILY